ncbi:hypothetical protein [Rhizobium hainanense]|uniref:Uncharacterized protein n=1 Tax=Rhizobium hainanense TaxID=52131 RepID=A0A1C3WJI0_9HYPH|nr:hypothetical protein [Rhizobium hainanense]SCB40193.1 hypothetical protein GA0061100_12312 [Rhizobium hainanense]
MTKQVQLPTDLLHRRMTLVNEVAGLNAKALKMTQMLAGTEMEVLRIELEISREGVTGQLVRNLHEVEDSATSIRLRQKICEDQIAEAEEAIAEIDRLLEERAGS